MVQILFKVEIREGLLFGTIWKWNNLSHITGPQKMEFSWWDLENEILMEESILFYFQKMFCKATVYFEGHL